MKILLVNVFRHKGSTGQIITDLGNYLQSCGNQVIYAFREGPHAPDKKEYCIGRPLETALTYRLNYLTGHPYGGAWLSTYRLMCVIKKEQPDLISFHSINGSYINIPWLLKWIEKQQIPVTFTHHSEYLYTGNCVHSYFCDQWINGCQRCAQLEAYHLSRFKDTTYDNYFQMQQAMQKICNRAVFISVSPWVLNRAKQSSLLKNSNQQLVLNGINEQIFRPRPVQKLREQLAAKNKKIVLFCTALFSDEKNDRKGSSFVIELAKRLQELPIQFVIVALETHCHALLPNNVKLYGAVQNKQKLAELYNAADVLLLTSMRETYSMPTAEALLCGTPVVGFCAGGPESIALPAYSVFVPYGDMNALEKVLLQQLKLKANREKIHTLAKSQYGSETMGRKYYSIFTELLTHTKEKL